MRRRLLCAVVVLVCVTGYVQFLKQAPVDLNRVTLPPEFSAAAQWRALAWLDEDGRYPVDGLSRAARQLNAMRSRTEPGTAEEIARDSWVSIGPGNVGGRVRAIAIHPTTHDTMFAAGVTGGIWKTTNGGTTWAGVNDFLPHLAVTSIIFKPGASSVMFAGTGEYFAGFQGDGIFTSTDGGTTWTALSSTTASTTTDFQFVNRLAMSADGTTLVAATSVGVFRSTDDGQSWTRTLNLSGLSPAPGRAAVADVRFLPGSNTRLVATGMSRNAYYSTDGGATWTVATGPTQQTNLLNVRVELGVSASTPAVVYMVVDDLVQLDDFATLFGGGRVWRSTDSGASYTLVSSPGHMARQGGYNNVVWVDPTDASRVVIGGIDLHRSTDSGATWTRISVWEIAPASAHADHHAIVSHPAYDGSTNKTVFFGNDGGIYKTTDVLAAPASINGSSGLSIAFTALNNQLGITQFYGAAGATATGRIVAGSQDNGNIEYTPSGGANGWTTILGGDGGFTAIDPTGTASYVGQPYSAIYRRDGSTGGFIHGCNPLGGTTKSAPYIIDEACGQTANFIAPLVMDPNEPARLLAGAHSLWRTNDARTANTSSTGPAWAAIKPPITGNNRGISAIAVAPGASDIVWVGHNNGELFVTSTGTAATPSWAQVDGTTLPNRQVTSVAVDPQNNQIAYVAFGGFTADNVWKTTDLGQTWSSIAGSGGGALPSLPIRAIAVHPSNSSRLYVGTELGVLHSTDGGATWTVPHSGPASVAVYQLFWMGTRLVAVTHGRGLFMSATDGTLGTFAVSPSSMTFEANKSGTTLQTVEPKTVSVFGVTGAWSATASESWIAITNGSGTGTGQFQVTLANPSDVIGSSTSLSGSITLTGAAVNSPVTIPVTAAITHLGTLAASPSSLALQVTKSGTTLIGAPSRTISVSGVTVGWTATSTVSWLQVSGGSGTGTGEFQVTVVNPSDVIGSQTQLTGALTLTAEATNSPLSIPVTLAVSGLGTFAAAPTALSFGATKSGATLTTVTPAQAVTISGVNGSWSAAASASWLQLSSSSGSGTGQVQVSIVNPGDVIGGSGTLTGTITVTGAATNSPFTIPVTLRIHSGATAVPFGQVDTPSQNATGVQGAIGVTGWTLDDIGVAGVKIYRNCLLFDNPASCQDVLGHSVVFVGDAAFLEGARPDVAGAFTTSPQPGRAGWGYLMLTSMLPHVTNQQQYGGQGPLTLYAVAIDIEGNKKLLGRSSDPASPDFVAPTSITMANDAIAKPFGAIDTPAQGATVSGVLNNFGWALTPDGNTAGGEGSDILIPTNGSTMTVFIDGMPVALVAYNQCRGSVGNPVPSGQFCNDDVSNIFGNPTPQAVLTPRTSNPTRYRNLDAARSAIGVYSFNTATLANGLHTIAWSVTDSAGRTEGIGSRFFIVLNTGGDKLRPH